MDDELSTIYKERKALCACGKVNFDKKTAQTKKNVLERRGNKRHLRIYQCNMSDWWHLTSTGAHNRRK